VTAPELHRNHRTGARRARPGRKDDPAVIRPGTRPATRAATRSRAALVAVAVASTVALAGCAAGQVAQTAYQANSSTGATVTVNGIAVRDAQIAFPDSAEAVQSAAVYRAGGTAPVEMHVINESTQGDRLVSASSPVAGSVTVGGETDLPAGTVMVVGSPSSAGGQTAPGSTEPSAESPIGSSGASSSPAPTNSASENTSPTGSASASGEAPAAGLQPPPVLGDIDPSTRFAQVELTGLREDIQAGLSYELILTFERAGQVRVMLPVGYPAEPRAAAEQE
jgi:copper(I)-binding protein